MTEQETQETHTLLTYRIADLPDELVTDIPADSPVRKCLFWATRVGSSLTSDLFDAIAEPNIDDVNAGIKLTGLVGGVLSRSHRFAELVRPDEVPKGGRIYGAYSAGFHTADGDEVEAWLKSRAELVPATELLPKVLILSVTHEGNPVSELRYSSHTMNAGFKYALQALATPGYFAVDREDEAFRKFDLILGEDGDEKKLTVELAGTGSGVVALSFD